MRFNIVHNYIFIIIDDINNYIHKSKSQSPLMPHVSISGSTSLCNKKTGTLQKCAEEDETVGMAILRCSSSSDEPCNRYAPSLYDRGLLHVDRRFRVLMNLYLILCFWYDFFFLFITLRSSSPSSFTGK